MLHLFIKFSKEKKLYKYDTSSIMNWDGYKQNLKKKIIHPLISNLSKPVHHIPHSQLTEHTARVK